MRILFLVDPLGNYVSDTLYIGLGRTTGVDVIDFPAKKVLHDPDAKIWYLPQVTMPSHSEEQIIELLSNKFFDLVCVASPRPESIEVLDRLYRAVRFPPIVFIDSADEPTIRHDLVRRFPFAAYFKREHRWGDCKRIRRFYECARSFHLDRRLFERTYPLPMSIVPETIPSSGRDAKVI